MSDEPWYDDPDRAQPMPTITTNDQPDELDQISAEVHAEAGQPPHPDNLADAAEHIGRYARRAPTQIAGRVVNGIVVSDDMVAAIWFSYHGNTPLGTEDAIDRACRRHLQQKATEPIRPELGTLIQELRERRATSTADLPELRT